VTIVFQKVLNYKPSEQDYRIWLVLNPAVWLIPIFALVLLIAIAVHAMVFSMPEYSWTKADDLSVAPAMATETSGAQSASLAGPR
jgi:light-harvesting protein B-800-850 alpha chain